MKFSSKTFAVAMLATLFVGMFIGSALTWKCGKQPDGVTTYIPDPLLALQLSNAIEANIQLRQDLQDLWQTWTFTTADGQTITVDSTTKWQDVPVIQTNFDDAFTIKVNNSPLTINVYGYIITKGRPDSLIIRPRKTTYYTQIKTKRKIVDPYGTVAVGINWGMEMCGEVEVGLLFWDKVAVFGKVYADEWPVKVKPYAGLKYILF